VPAELDMPETSGMQVLERIMAIDPATDVVLMTAHRFAGNGRRSDHKRRGRLSDQAGPHRTSARARKRAD
jgi:hypothetical protein